MHVLLIVGSVVLAIVQLTSSWLLARKSRKGWLLSMSSNVLGIPYDALTSQYGFVIVSSLNLVVAIRGWRAWKEDKPATPVLTGTFWCDDCKENVPLVDMRKHMD
jgi:nicotinamide riboside transporter PnuC